MGAHDDAGWLGGVLGATRTIPLKNPSDAFDIMAIAPNNQPVTSESQFYGLLRMLKPTVVGLGEEDFDRKIRGTGSAKNIADFIINNADLPFLASNVVIRHSASNLNTVKSGDFRLHVTRDASVDWTKPIAVDYPRAKPGVTLQSYDACPVNARPTADGRAETATLGDKKEGMDATLDVTDGLRPGRCYRLDLAEDPGHTGTFWITTDSLLTPRRHDVGRYSGLPVIMTSDGDLVIVNVVDPAARSRAAASAWKWKDGGVDHEMLIADPADYLASLFTVITPEEKDSKLPRKRQPIVVLMSAASDATTLAVLEKFPQIRFVILPQESQLLARAAPAITNDRPPIYGGDLGFAAIVDPVYHSATKIFLRPEWFGETMVTATAHLHTATFDWIMESPDVKVQVVEGTGFDWKPGEKVTYQAVIDKGNSVDVGEGQAYVDCPETNAPTPRCTDFIGIWSSQKTVAAMLGDAVRQAAHADLAVVPAKIVDEDFTPWVRRMIDAKKHDASWVSNYILVRAVYAAPRMVRAYVSGNDLPATLGKILQDSADNCISGLGSLCPAADANHPANLTVNGRRVDRRLFYSIVMPDALAEKFGLDHDDVSTLSDPLKEADEYLKRGDWYVAQANGVPALPTRVERRGNGRHSGYLAVNTLDFGWSKVTLKDPGTAGTIEASAIRANLRQLDYAGAEASQTTTWSIDSDFAPWDEAAFAVRVPVTFSYSKKEQGDSISYDKDQLSVGARYDQKLHVLGELRLFGGAFVDGPFHNQKGTVSPTRVTSDKGAPITVTESPAAGTPFVFKPSRFIHGAVGAELMGYREFPMGRVKFQPTVLGGRWAYGKETRIPTAVTLAGEPLDFLLFTQAGTKAALNAFFKNHPAFRSGVPLEIEDAPRWVHRPQLDAQGKIAITGKKTYTTDVAVQLRFYRYADRDPNLFALKYAHKYDVKFTSPLVGRINLVPHLIYQRAGVTTGTTRAFQYLSFDVSLSVPFVKRWGQGSLIR